MLEWERMESLTLEYGRHESRVRWGALLRWVGGVVGVVVAVLLMLSVTVRERVMEVDAVTGSARFQSQWLGISMGWRHEASVLEKRLAERGVSWNADWRFVSARGSNLLGWRTQRSCGRLPRVRCGSMDAFVARATDEQLRGFVRAMETGTDQEQAAMVEECWNETWRRAGGEVGSGGAH